MGHRAEVTIAPADWCADAERILAGSIIGAPCFTVADYRAACERGARLFRVTAEGELVGFVVLDVDHQAGGAEGVILAAAGDLAGVDLTAELLPALEGLFTGVRAVRVCSARPGFIRKLASQGYRASHMVFRKDMTHAPA